MQIAVACYTKRPEMYQNIVENILRQTRKPDVVTFVVHRVAGDIDLVKRSLISNGIVTFASTVAGTDLTIHDVQRMAYNAADGLVEAGSISEFEDDDWYGPGYLAEVEAAFTQRPGAIATGKNEAIMRFFREGYTQERKVSAGGLNSDGSCINVLGSSISISVSAWRENPWIRFWPIVRPGWTSYPDCDFVDAMKSHNAQIWPTGPDNFAVCRYYDPEHDHTWKYHPPEFQ